MRAGGAALFVVYFLLPVVVTAAVVVMVVVVVVAVVVVWCLCSVLAILLLSFQTLPSSQPEQVVALASQHHIKDNTMAAVARYLDNLGALSTPASSASSEASAFVPEPPRP